MTWDQHASEAIRQLEYATDVTKRPDLGNLPGGEFDKRDRVKVWRALDEAFEHIKASRREHSPTLDFHGGLIDIPVVVEDV